MYVYESCDNKLLSEFMKDRKQNRRCSVYLSNLKLTAFHLYAVVSSLAVSFANVLIG